MEGRGWQKYWRGEKEVLVQWGMNSYSKFCGQWRRRRIRKSCHDDDHGCGDDATYSTILFNRTSGDVGRDEGERDGDNERPEHDFTILMCTTRERQFRIPATSRFNDERTKDQRLGGVTVGQNHIYMDTEFHLLSIKWICVWLLERRISFYPCGFIQNSHTHKRNKQTKMLKQNIKFGYGRC